MNLVRHCLISFLLLHLFLSFAMAIIWNHALFDKTKKERKVNLAFSKPSYASEPIKPRVVRKGNDNSLLTIFHAEGYFPWWEVDLMDDYFISLIRFYGTAGVRHPLSSKPEDQTYGLIGIELRNAFNESKLLDWTPVEKYDDFYPGVERFYRYVRAKSQTRAIWVTEMQIYGEKATWDQLKEYYASKLYKSKKSDEEKASEKALRDTFNRFNKEKDEIKDGQKEKNGQTDDPTPDNDDDDDDDEDEDYYDEDIISDSKSTSDLLSKRFSTYGIWIISVAASISLSFI